MLKSGHIAKNELTYIQKKATLIKLRHKGLNNYRQGSEWCVAVGVVFDIMTNYQSIHDLRAKEILQTGSFQIQNLLGNINYNGSL